MKLINYAIQHDHNYAHGPQSRVNFSCINVCGLLSKVNLGVIDEYIQHFDFVCLSETKTDSICDDTFPGFTYIPMRKKESRPNHKFGGIHGLGILIRDEYYKHVTVIDKMVSESIHWLKNSLA